MCCGRDKCLLITGGILLTVGAIIGGCWLFIYDAIFRWQLVLTPTSTSYGIWEDIPIPIYMEFTMFNVTNAAKVEKDPNVIPEVVEMGPYVFREYHRRVNVSFINYNHSVTYRQMRSWVFEPDKSGGTLDDMITNYNIIAATTAYGTRYLTPILQMFISRLMEKANATLLVTRSVRELIFEGYDDPLLDVAQELNSSLFTIPFTKFGYFVDRNNSYEYDGWFNMYTGADDIAKLGMHYQWNFETHTRFYGFPCNEVRGSTGEIWPPLSNYDGVEIFAPDICQTLKLSYNRETEMAGVPGLEYIGTDRTLDNGELYPELSCQCTGECVPTGALNISLCRWDAPIFVTMPHFYLADPSFLSYSSGLQPDVNKHQVQFALNPVSGIPLYANARLQLNLMMEPFPNIGLFKDLKRRIFVPMMWFNQKVILTDDLAPMVKLLLMAPQLGAGIFFGMAAVGTSLLLLGLAFRMKPAWSDEDDHLLSAEDDPAAHMY